MRKIPYHAYALIIISVTHLYGCGGSDNDEDTAPTTEPVLQGVLIDSAIEGVTYSTATLSGVTDEEGTFEYRSGEEIVFTIAGMNLGTSVGDAIITPIDLLDQAAAGTDATLNLLRFLQTLDSDQNPDNGLQLTGIAELDLSQYPLDFEQSIYDFENDQFLTDIIATVEASSNSEIELVSGSAALQHFRQSLEDQNLLTAEPTTKVYLSVNVDAREHFNTMRWTRVTTAGSQIGVPQAVASNGYSSEILTFTYPDFLAQVVTTSNDESAQDIADSISNISGVSTSASTTLYLSNLTNSSGNLTITVNGALVGSGTYTMADIADSINNELGGISASEAAGVVTISSAGDDIMVSLNNTGDVADTVEVSGVPGSASNVLLGNGAGDGLVTTVGGTITLTMDEGITLTTSGGGAALFESTIVPEVFVLNEFDPLNPNTYNHSTSTTIYDSQGNPHTLTIYFARESATNEWTAYVLIDGLDIGDPNPSLEAPLDSEPTRASFKLVFCEDDSLLISESDPIQISYWNPEAVEGQAQPLQGLPVSEGGSFPVPLPAASSNFEIDLSGTTRIKGGSVFEVYRVFQNGGS